MIYERVEVVVPGDPGMDSVQTSVRIAAALREKYPDLEPTDRPVKVRVAVHPGMPPRVTMGDWTALQTEGYRESVQTIDLSQLFFCLAAVLEGTAYKRVDQVVSFGIMKRHLDRPEVRVEVYDIDATMEAA